PFKRCFQPVIPPEEFVTDKKTRRAEDPARNGFFRLRPEPVLVCLFAGAREKRLRIKPERSKNVGKHGLVRNIFLLREIGEIDAARERRPPILILTEKRKPRGLQSILRKAHRFFQLKPSRLANARHVAPHIFSLGGIDIEGAVIPPLRAKDRCEQERPPAKRDPRFLRRRFHAHRCGIGIGARKLVPELDLHGTPPTPLSPYQASASRRSRQSAQCLPQRREYDRCVGYPARAKAAKNNRAAR